MCDSMLNLGRFIARAATYWPSNDALVCDGRRWTYAELDARSNRLASALAGRGIAVGGAVATFAANRAELVEVEVALYKGGLLRVPINHRLGFEEVRHILADADVRLLLTDAAHADTGRRAARAAGREIPVVVFDAGVADADSYDDLLAAGDEAPVAVDVGLDAPSVLHFTSGSTGRLKAAVQTTGNRLANMRKRLMDPDAAASPDETYLVAGPITHASGMGLLALMSRGATIVVLPAFTPQAFLDLIAQERVTSTFLVPTMLNMVLAHPGRDTADVSSLKVVRVGGAPVSPQRLRDAVALFGPVVMQGYGQAETTSGVTTLTRADVVRGIESDPELLLSCGRAQFDTEIRVVDEQLRPVPTGVTGELVVRGPDCVTEYWHEPELSAETFRDGWVLTGDVAYLREDGYVFIVDRKKDMIISGGFNIYCSEVEAALYEHPAVVEACVVGVPDEKWGEAVKAVVVPRSGAGLDPAELIAFCADRLDRLKKPQSVDLVDALPVNRNGKIDRRAVRAPYWAGSDRAVN
ncbi:acyl-CoA synthetase [Pseudonocardia kunmingensis]|nr:long-chain fatty acid--CoA ligase [Pseudonocardia kunmingensis]